MMMTGTDDRRLRRDDVVSPRLDFGKATISDDRCQVRRVGKNDSLAQARFICTLFGVAI